jgi:alpha-mannosidase
MLKHFCLSILVGAMAVGADAQQKRIYIANDDHIDYLWSADEETYKRAFINMLDFYIRKADSTIAIGLPSHLQSRFNCDGSLWLWTYEQNKSVGEVNALVAKIQSGHISVPFNAVNSCYGGMPAEAALRGMYYAGSVERRFKLDLDIALAMEHATLPLGIASLWAGAGAKYSWKGICACNTPFGRGNPSYRDKEVYWYTGLDGRKILMKWYSLNDTVPPGGVDKNQSLGGYSEARNPFYAVKACQDKFNTPNFKMYDVVGAFGYGWDDIETYNSDDFINAARSKTDTGYQVIVSNQLDFFTDFENSHGASLPAFSASYGNERDLLCASLAETSAKVKRSLEKLRSAEALATLVAHHKPHFGRSLDSARIKAWMGYGLYWEHDWSVFGGVAPSSKRAAWERKIENQISSYSNILFDSAKIELGQQIQKSGRRETFYVFNPLSWQRTDYADYPYSGSEEVSVVDLSTGLPVENQIVMKDGVRCLRILATKIPEVGYKVFEIRSGERRTLNTAASVSANNTVIENGFYKVTINASGAIESLLDKKNGSRECIGDENANDLGSTSSHGTITVENAGPVSVTLKAHSADPLAHTSRITLYKALSRIDIDNQITENFTNVRHWKFAFNLRFPETWHEEAGAILKAKLLSHGGHYAQENALYKYLTLNHFASVNENKYGITLSNRDCYFFRLGKSTHTSLDETSGTLDVLAGGRVSNPELGIVGQDGDSEFNQSFALKTHTNFSKVSEMRFALEHQTPLVTGEVTGAVDLYPGNSYSYLRIADSNVLLWSLKPSEEGYGKGGIIIRTWNLGNETSTGKITLEHQIGEAYETSHVETDIRINSFADKIFTTRIPAQALSTHRIKLVPGRRN